MTGTCAACGATFTRLTVNHKRCAGCRQARSPKFYDLPPAEIEARFQAALADIKARDRRVDPWEQRPDYEGPEALAPLAAELPTYHEAEKARKVLPRTAKQWNRNPR